MKSNLCISSLTFNLSYYEFFYIKNFEKGITKQTAKILLLMINY